MGLDLIGQPEWCEVCDRGTTITDVHDETIGYEEKAVEVVVIDYACGHDNFDRKN